MNRDPTRQLDTTDRRNPPPRFVTGSLLTHILVMTGTGAVGLIAIFAGDLANMLFLSMLGDEQILAAVGYASSVMFLTIAIGIGLSIAATALVSPALGAGLRVKARRLSTHAHILTAVGATVLSVAVIAAADPILRLLGAQGRALDLASDYLLIVVPSMPLLALGMTSAAILRSAGDARGAMNVTLGGAIVNVLLDPLFIFGLDMGLHGAAIASAVARVMMAAVGLYAVIVVHQLMGPPRRKVIRRDARDLLYVAIPAILTNVAAPAANAYVTAAIAAFGDGAVAGWAIVGRIVPVAFGGIYALSGIVGPILGQNLGAGQIARVRRTFTLSLYVMAAYTATAWLALAIAAEPLARVFQTTGEPASLIVFFCRWLAPLFVFMGALFVSAAAFNTLGRPRLSTVLNWVRATAGTIPFVYVGGLLGGAHGVLAGNMLGGIAFGGIAVWLAYRHIDSLSQGTGLPADVSPVSAAAPSDLIPGSHTASAVPLTGRTSSAA